MGELISDGVWTVVYDKMGQFYRCRSLKSCIILWSWFVPSGSKFGRNDQLVLTEQTNYYRSLTKFLFNNNSVFFLQHSWFK